MEENEVFDSSLLKETINQLIATGKRNFALDMSPLDYIYSDTINMLMALNRRVLDVTGRLALMAPQPEVIQILKRGGIHNILRVFETETELIKSSEDMIMQTSSLQRSDIEAAKKGVPESEFDQLRSEIGSVFDSSEGHPHVAQPVQQGYSKPPQEDDFDQMFQQFETGPGRGMSHGVVPPVSPQIPTPQTPKFQPRQYTQPPAQPMPRQPSGPPQRPQVDIPQHTGTGDFSSVRPETQRFTSAPVPPSPPTPSYQGPPPPPPESPEDEDVFEAAPKSKAPKKIKMRDDFDSFDNDDFDDEFKKKSPLPAILLVLLIVALGGAGAFVIYLATSKQKPPSELASIQTPEAPKPPQVPVATTADSVKPEVKDTVQTPEKPDEKIVAPKPVIKKPPVTTRKPRTRPRRRPRPPKPSVPKTENKVIISSLPSGASVFIDGKRMGETPFTWKKPYFGSVTVTLSKTGYEDLKESFKFTGGTIKKPFTLKKAVSKPPKTKPSTPVVKTPVKKPPVVTTKPKPPPPPVSDDEEDPFAGGDFEDDEEDLFDDEPVSTPTTKPPVSKPAPPPVTRTPPPSSGGGQASIFIASIPPVADVYLGDKLIGKTNVSELKIPAGVQTLKFVKGAKQITKQLTLKPGKNPSQMVRIP